MPRRTTFLTGLLLLGSYVGCSTVKVQVPRWFPARAFNIAACRRLEIGLIEAPDRRARQVAAQIKAGIMSGLSGSGVALASGGTAGQRLSISGTVTSFAWRETLDQVWQTCRRRVTVDGKDTLQEHRCLARTRRVDMDLHVQLTVADARSGVIRHTKQYSHARWAWTSAIDARPDTVDLAAMTRASAGEVVSDFLRDVLPHTRVVTVVFHKDRSVPELSSAIHHVKSGNLGTATRIFRESLKRVQARPGASPELIAKVRGDLGITLALQGDYASALSHLAQAARLTGDRRILEQRRRVSRWQELQQKLDSQRAAERDTTPSDGAR